ncbi:MAG: hypothetical protein AABW83_04445 [Nanoarchaeota archaeon]
MRNGKNLEGKLRAIQELKSEKYVGTQEAFNYIERISAFYDNPGIISEEINRELAKNGDIIYPATPQIILGLGDFLEKIVNEYNIEIDDPYLENDYDVENSPIFEYDYLICGGQRLYKSQEDRNPGELSKYLIEIFKEVQSTETSNQGFGVYVLYYSLEKFGSREDKMKSLLNKALSADWDYIFSLENFRNIQKKLKNSIFSEEIRISDRIKRMKRDQVDHRLENRREILTDFIGDFIAYKEEGKDISYDFLREFAKATLEESKRRYKRFIDLKVSPNMIRDEEDIMEKRNFILTTLAPERNFVNRYLRN